MVAALWAATAEACDSPSWWAIAVSESAPAIDAGWAGLIRSKVTIRGSTTVLGERRQLGLDQRRVGPRRTPHGLAGVVDDDVEGPRGGDVVGQRDDLGGVAQVDADDLEAVDPVPAVGQRGEAA